MTSSVDKDALVAMMPFAVTIGVEVETAAPKLVTGHLAWSPERCTAAGIMHGGALGTLADSIAAVCAFLNLPPGAATSTIESKINFFRAVRGGTVHGKAEPVHVGRTTIAVQTDLTDDQGKLVARVLQTQAVIQPG